MARRGFSLEADIQPTVDDSAAEDEAEGLADTFEGELGDLQVGANADGLGEGMGSPGGRGGGVAGATAGAAAGRGGIGSMLKGGGAAAAALPVALAGATAFGILKGVQALSKHSPALSQTMGLLSEAMSLFFRPFGNALSDLIRPMAEGLLTMATNFNDVVDSNGLIVGMGWLAASIPLAIANAFGDIMEDIFGFGFSIDPEDIFDQAKNVSADDVISLGQSTFAGSVELGQWIFSGSIDLGQWMFSGAINLGQWLFDEATSISWDDIKWTGSIAWGAIKWTGSISWDLIEWTGNIAWDLIEWTGSISWDAIKWTGSIAWGAITWAGSIGWGTITWAGNISWGAITWGGELLWSAINWAGSISPSNIISGSIDIANYVTGSISGGDSGGWVPGVPDPGDVPDHIPDTDSDYDPRNWAQGGVARRPVTRTIGEAGPEAVMPLDDLGRMVSRAIRQGVRGAQGVGGNGGGMGSDAASELRTVVRELRKTRKAIEGLDTGGTNADAGAELDPF